MATPDQLAAAIKRAGVRNVARLTRIPASTVSAACRKMLDEPLWRVVSMCRAVHGAVTIILHQPTEGDVPGQLRFPLPKRKRSGKIRPD